MQIKSTRQRILDILSSQDQASAAELSRALAVTQANIRYHLTNMVEEGLIVQTKTKHSGRRGRPARRFRLASKSKQENYTILSAAFLDSMRALYSDQQLESFLMQAAQQFTGDIKPAGSLGSRLVHAVDRLNSYNYQARWEAHANSPRVIFEHCPFAALRPHYPELCRLDTHLIEIFLDEAVDQSEARAHLEDGICLFNITQKSISG